ncbi:MAG: ATP-dependent DNA helicase RecG [Bacilli bacterium]
MDLNSIKGVGEKTILLLEKLNLVSIEDIITYYPYRYNVYKISDALIDNEVITINGVVESIPRVNYIKRNLNRLSFRFFSNGLIINVTIFNRAFLKKNINIGKKLSIVGRYNKKNNTFIANDIKFEVINGLTIEPVYHLVNGLTNKLVNKIILEILKTNIDIDDYIPSYLASKYQFINKIDAIKEIHNPTNGGILKKSKLRLIYEEFFLFMFKVNYLKYKYIKNSQGLERHIDKNIVMNFIKSLPFELTTDQLSAVEDIFMDLVAPKRMNRLILGDVGSGKTVVSVIAIYINYLSGYQSALMAPTEILAMQHYDSIKKLLKNTNVRISLLVGSMKKKEKEEVTKKILNGEVDLVIGTHALLSNNVLFKNLGLVVTDEQHRFGVNQRSNLQNKGIMSDVLYMSATPIPRTYALTIYGDMDTSIIKAKPNGRKDIITKVTKDIKEVLNHMYKELMDGHQAYVVAPLIEDEDGNNDMESVVSLKEKFMMAFQNKYRIEILHGKMKSNEKDIIMEDFKNGIINVLISTTVIEVGVDVKNSTMMVIFNAERFGLATLHQLRGRVGRNDLQSYCYLICNKDKERLRVMEESNDGFYISEKDFELRGEGDLFGVRQSGDMVFKIGDLRKDYKIMLQAKNDAQAFIKDNVENDFANYSCYKRIIKMVDFID